MKKMMETTGNAFHEIGTNKNRIFFLAVLPWLMALLAEPFFMLRMHGITMQTFLADLTEHGLFFTAVWGCGMIFPTLCYMMGELNETFSIGVDLLDDLCIEEEEITERCGHVGIFSVSSALICLVILAVLEKELACLGVAADLVWSTVGIMGFLVLCVLTAQRIRMTADSRKELLRLGC